MTRKALYVTLATQSQLIKKKNTMKTTATADLSPPGDYGNLHLLSTREFIRPATLEEYTAAWLADFGWILTVDGLTCYLQF